MNITDPRFPTVRYVTNAMGFADRDYPAEPPAHTRRLVVLGDSLPRALGVEPGLGFEARLEDRWNREPPVPGRQLELINMGVSGYRITQVMDLALEEAPRLEPDVYVLVVSWLTVARKWGLHLAQLVEDDIDLKYDFLRSVARDAGLKRGDTTAATEAKLAPFMEPTLRWAVTQIQARARQDDAAMVVVLMPHLKGIGSYEPVFGPMRAMLAKERIPYLDLLDAFDDLDIAALDVGDGLHPNAEGHRHLAELIHRRLSERPDLAHVFFGESNGEPIFHTGTPR